MTMKSHLWNGYQYRGRTAYLLRPAAERQCLLAGKRTVSGLSAQYFVQLSRAGVRIVVGHGHGPSIHAFQELTKEAEEKYGLRILRPGHMRKMRS